MRWDSGLCSMFNVVGLKFVHEGKMGKVDVISKSFTFQILFFSLPLNFLGLINGDL